MTLMLPVLFLSFFYFTVFFFIPYFGHTFDLGKPYYVSLAGMALNTLLVTWAPQGGNFWKDLQIQKERLGNIPVMLHPLWYFLSKHIWSHTWFLWGRTWGVHMLISFPLPQPDDYLGSSAVLLRHFSVKFVFPHWTLSRISSAKSQKPSGAIKR